MSVKTPGQQGDGSQTSQRGPAERRTLFGVAALACLVCVVFFPVLRFEFVGQDVRAQVVDNPHVHGLTIENLKHILTTRCITSYYPVRALSFALDYQLWGPNPAGFKLTSALVHWANVLLVFWLIGRLFRHFARDGSRNPWWDLAAATFAAGMYAIHPVVVEPVVCVTAREELLTTLGALGTIHFHVTARRFSEQGGKTQWAIACHVGAALCCLAACMSNAMGAVIPLVAVAWDLLTLPKPRFWRVLRGTLALWGIAAATIVIKQAGEVDYPSDPLPLFSTERLTVVLTVYGLNVKTLIWPMTLMSGYPKVSPASFSDVGVVLGGVAVAGTCATLWMLRRRKLILFGLFWFGLALLPSAQIIPHHIQRADRFLYLPLAGLAVALGMALGPLGDLMRRRAVTAAAIVAGVLCLVVLNRISATQIWIWQNEITAREHTLKLDPDNPTNHCALADRLGVSGQYGRAVEMYERGLRLFPEDARIPANYAWLLASCDDQELRNYPLAVELAERACRLSRREEPKFFQGLAMIYFRIAEDMGERGEVEPARRNYEKAVEVLFQLAMLLAAHPDEEKRRPEEAVRLAERACQLAEEPDCRQLRTLAEIYAQTGRFDNAAGTIEKAIDLAEADGDQERLEELRRRLTRYEKASSPSRSGD